MKCKMLSAIFYILVIYASMPWISAQSYEVKFIEIPTVTSALFDTYTRENLTHVKLNYCGIKNIDKDSFQNMTSLERFDVSKNYLEILDVGTFQYSLELKFINLSSNELKELKNGVFANLHKVIRLSLQKNVLETLGSNVFEDMVALNYLDLWNNHISTLDANIFRNNKRLSTLSLSQNYIKDLDKNIFRNLSKLLKLYITRNQISQIDKYLFSNLLKLQELSLSYNMLQKIDSTCFHNTINLHKLWLAQNQLSNLDNGLFYFLTKLQFLHIGNNLITHIGKNAFPNVSVLKEVYLGNNKLQYLHNDTTNILRNVTELSLYDNPWFCDCHLKDLYNIWKNHVDYLHPKCEGPAKLRNVSWLQLTPKDFLYCRDLEENSKTNDSTIDMDIDNNEDKMINNCSDVFTGKNISFTCKTRQEIVQGLYSVVQSRIYEKNGISNLNIKNSNIDDEEIYKCQITDSHIVQPNKFALKISFNRSKMGNDNLWKFACLASLAFIALIVVIIIIFLTVKKFKRISPVYDVPDTTLRTTKAESMCYDVIKPSPEIMAERQSCVYDQLKLPNNVVNLQSALCEELKRCRTASVDEDGYLVPRLINK